jgi:3D (Asp-Asp-Asp) domain-containing protein
MAEGCAGRAHPAAPVPNGGASNARSFTATAYCKGQMTASGNRPMEKTVAADPTVLPMGSRIKVSGLDARYDGVYIVQDTGSSIRGRRIDLYLRDCHEAVNFGRRAATVSTLR